MATYTAEQLQDDRALNTDRFMNNGEFNAIKMSIKLNMIPRAERSIADVGQCALFIETLNLGTNPTVAARETNPPFGRNPTVNYMDAGYKEEEEGVFVLKTNVIADEGTYGFYPQPPVFFGFEQTITFESLGIQHNLSKIPGCVCHPDPLATSPLFELCYLPQRNEGRKIAAFTFNNDNINQEEGIMKTFYWYPSNNLTEYGGEGGEEEFLYGSVRFRGVGNFDLTTAAVTFIGEG